MLKDKKDEGSKFELEPLEKKHDGKLEDFDDILELVGSEGTYQKNLLYFILTPLSAIMPVFVLNRIFLLSVPDHWCHVPGRPNGTELDTWKNLTLPWEAGPDGNMRQSQCEMFDSANPNIRKRCESWDFDRTNYKSTIPTEYAWVCDHSHYPADVFSIAGFGNVAGTIIFGQLADKFGRKTFFFCTIYIYLIFSISSLFVPQHFIAYLTLTFLASTSFPFMFSSPALIAAEFCSKEYRAWIYSVVWMACVIGNAALPVIAYLIGSWFEFGIVTTLPALIPLIYYKFLDESPRWLLSVGRIDEAHKIMAKVARKNGKTIEDDDLKSALNKVSNKILKENKETMGIWTLFTRRKLALNTIMLCIAWSVNGLTYYAVTLNTTSMSGNEFLNFFLLALIELPGGWLAGVLVEKSGRRWTQAAFFVVCALALAVASCAVLDPNLSWVILICALIVKFGVSLTSLVGYLQGTEIFPTQLRSTGSAFASTVCSIIGTCGPYIVHLGKFYAAAPYMILMGICCVGAVSSACLPETLHQSLPETVEAANNFGKKHKFWSYLPEDALYVQQQTDKKNQNPS